MSALDCIADIKGLVDGLTDDELTDILEELDKRRRARLARGEADASGAVLLADAEELAGAAELALMVEKRQRAINVLRKLRREEIYAASEDPHQALMALNVGVNANIDGGRLSVDARGLGIERTLIGSLVHDLRQAGLLDVFRTAHRSGLDRDIAVELFELRPGGQAGRSGSREAAAIAEIVARHQEAARAMQNEAGAWIRPMPGYIVRQSHDPIALRRAGFAAWREAILPALDPRTFEGVEDPDAFLQAAYNGLVSGVHLHARGAAPDDWLMGFKGPGSLAKRVSQSRVLHFADGGAWYDYNSRFGTRRLMPALLGGLKAAADNTALMEVWGTNPRAAFDADLRQLQQRYQDNPEVARTLTGDTVRGQALQWQFAQITNEVGVGGSLSLAQVSAGWRAVESMAKLGGAVISSITDLPVRAAAMRRQGIGLLDAYATALRDLGPGMNSGARRETADLIGAGLDGLLGDVMSRISAEDGLPGMASSATSLFMKASGLTWWTDRHKTGVGLVFARHLAQNAERGFEALDPDLARVLRQYRIGPEEWAAVRLAAADAADGRRYVTPDAVRGLPDSAVAHLAEGDAGSRALGRIKVELERRVAAFLQDQSDIAIITPGARERAVMLMGTKRGTPLGEAVRFIMQFKAFPIGFVTKALGQEFNAGASNRALGIVHLILATTVLGYVAQSAKEVTKGRLPRDPTDPKTWVAAFIQGGGLGIYGDFIFGDFNRFGGGLLETFAGPTLGTAGDIARLWARARDGEDFGPQLFQTVKNNTPFLNLFYLRGALDYLALYHIQEWLNPGYLRRMERRIARENNQSFILAPTSVVATGGGFR